MKLNEVCNINFYDACKDCKFQMVVKIQRSMESLHEMGHHKYSDEYILECSTSETVIEKQVYIYTNL